MWMGGGVPIGYRVEAIIRQDIWDAVHDFLKTNRPSTL